MTDKNKTATTGNSDGTILKPFLIDGGRYIVEVNLEDGLQYTAFSIRGVVDHVKIHDVLRSAEQFLGEIINDSKHSKNR